MYQVIPIAVMVEARSPVYIPGQEALDPPRHLRMPSSLSGPGRTVGESGLSLSPNAWSSFPAALRGALSKCYHLKRPCPVSRVSTPVAISFLIHGHITAVRNGGRREGCSRPLVLRRRAVRVKRQTFRFVFGDVPVLVRFSFPRTC